MERDVMALDAPAPGSFWRRRSEYRKVIKLGVAREAAVRAFQLRQDRLKADDRRGLLIAGRAQAGFHKLHRQLALVFIEIFERDPFTVAWNNGPVAPVLVGKTNTRFGLLFRRERGEEFVRGLGHRGG